MLLKWSNYIRHIFQNNYSLLKAPIPCFRPIDITSLPRIIEVLVNSLILGRIGNYFSNKINNDISPTCDTCNVPDDHDHICFYCTKFISSERDLLMDTLLETGLSLQTGDILCSQPQYRPLFREVMISFAKFLVSHNYRSILLK